MRLVLTLFVIACGAPVDSDGDGLSNRDEQEIGTDPDVPDTDGDGWSDGDEVSTGTDPLDAEDHPYTGGWPVNTNKDALGDPSWGNAYALEGTQVPRFRAIDQFGEVVDLYDFAGQDVPVLIEITSDSCERCVWMADLLAKNESPLSNDTLDRLPGLIERGEVWWIRVLATEWSAEQRTWDERYPVVGSPLLRDEEGLMWGFFSTYWGTTGNPASWPAVMRVDPDTMRVQTEPTDSLAWVSVLLEELDGN